MTRWSPLGAVVFILALWVQVLSPVAASLALAQADGGFDHLVICSQTAGNAEAPTSPGDATHRHDQCPLCRIAANGMALLDAAPLVFVALLPIESRQAWIAVSSRAPPDPVGRPGQPRGPPSFT